MNAFDLSRKAGLGSLALFSHHHLHYCIMLRKMFLHGVVVKHLLSSQRASKKLITQKLLRLLSPTGVNLSQSKLACVAVFKQFERAKKAKPQ